MKTIIGEMPFKYLTQELRKAKAAGVEKDDALRFVENNSPCVYEYMPTYKEQLEALNDVYDSRSKEDLDCECFHDKQRGVY